MYPAFASAERAVSMGAPKKQVVTFGDKSKPVRQKIVSKKHYVNKSRLTTGAGDYISLFILKPIPELFKHIVMRHKIKRRERVYNTLVQHTAASHSIFIFCTQLLKLFTQLVNILAALRLKLLVPVFDYRQLFGKILEHFLMVCTDF